MTTGTTKAVDRFVRVGDLNLHCLEWGQAGAPPVVMVHGLTGNAHAFDDLAPHFLPRYHVVSVDVRGRGDSDWAAGADYSNDAYVADLEGLRQALGFERMSLVGTSMGGRISLTYAGTYPDRVERTVLNDIGPEIDPRGGERIADSTRDAVTAFETMEEVIAWHCEQRAGFSSLSDAEQRAIRRSCGKGPARRRLHLEDGPGGPLRPPPSRPGSVLGPGPAHPRPGAAGAGRDQRPAVAGDSPAHGGGDAGLPHGGSARRRPRAHPGGTRGLWPGHGVLLPGRGDSERLVHRESTKRSD